MLRSVTATEELIGQKIKTRTTKKELVTHPRSSSGNKDAHESGLFILFFCTLQYNRLSFTFLGEAS